MANASLKSKPLNPTNKASLHLVINAFFTGLMTLFYLFIILGLIANAWVESDFFHAETATEARYVWITSCALGIGGSLGVILGTTLFYGLISRKAWTPLISNIFWTYALCVGCCMPFSIYGFLSLKLPHVRALFRQSCSKEDQVH